MKIRRLISYHKRKLDFQKQKLTDLEFFYKSENYKHLGSNEKITLKEAMNKCRNEIQCLSVTIGYLKAVKE